MPTLTKEDVFGLWDDDHNKVNDGLVVARGTYEGVEICPIFGDDVPWKSVTIVCTEDQIPDVEHWCIYVHGGDCFSKITKTDDGKVAIRSNYMAW